MAHSTIDFSRYSTSSSINDTILWLLEMGLPPIPIAPWHCHSRGDYYNCAKPGEPPQPKFTGKNPSFVSRNGNPILVNHQGYQQRLPNREELRRWFQDRRTGIATMGGWRNVVWVDVDAKQFESPEQCQAQVERWIERYGLERTYIERTGRGGYHVALRLPDAGNLAFTRFGFAELQKEGGVAHAGEVLGRGVPIVLAPTKGVVGQYRCLHRGVPLAVESLEAVGLRAAGVGVEVGGGDCKKSSNQLWFRTQTEKAKARRSKGWSRAPLLKNLLRQPVVDLLLSCDQVEMGARSDVLVTIAREAIGWQNWLLEQGYPLPIPDAETLVYQTGERLGLGQERVERIILSESQGVPVVESRPGLHFHKGDQGCRDRLRRGWRG